MKRGWTIFWLCVSGLIIAATAAAQRSLRPSGKVTSPRRANELTLARLRPGWDTLAKAKTLYGADRAGHRPGEQDALIWNPGCGGSTLRVAADAEGSIESVTVSDSEASDTNDVSAGDCAELRKRPSGSHSTALKLYARWSTGRGLSALDPCRRVSALYGAPSSRGPSMKGGRELELMFYQFDWAGPGVPQAMEVLCTSDKDGVAGHVVEITLSKSSF